jgi:hypothetical protein
MLIFSEGAFNLRIGTTSPFICKKYIFILTGKQLQGLSVPFTNVQEPTEYKGGLT